MLNIVQVSTADIGGGAESVAYSLFKHYRERGHNSWLVVGRKRSEDRHVLELSGGPAPQTPPGPGRAFVNGLRASVVKRPAVANAARLCVHPRRTLEAWLGVEDFNYPASYGALDLPPHTADIVHCHNLHGSYFDLRALPGICDAAPTILTLHDAWLMSGHCAHSLSCDRWKTGCGRCPDLSLYPAIPRDATAYNWERKRKILRQSQFYLATPSEWLMRKVRESILAPSVMEARVIPNGVELSVFKPGDRRAARAATAVPETSRMLLFVANGARRNPWKDYPTLRRAVDVLAAREPTREILFIGVGEEGATERIGNAQLRFVPFEPDASKLVPFYQAADLYVHAARADTFPTTVLEALACGTPVVASAVGGIPEQVKGLSLECCPGRGTLNRHGVDEATGVLIPIGDANAMADGIEILLGNDTLRRQLSKNGVRDAHLRFDIRQQLDRYLGWYERLLRIKRRVHVAVR